MEYSKNNWTFRNVKGLKDILCERCKAEGMHEYGGCEHCLRNRAHNKEIVETTMFVVNEMLEEYHSSSDSHLAFKQMYLREKNEHPFLYYGIEIEIGFDEDEIRIMDEDYENETTNRADEMLKEFSRITDGMFIYETDSTVYNGVELISRPMSYAKWTNPETVEKLKNGLEYLKEMGAYKTQPDGHGMHIHISRSFFDYGKLKRENSVEAYQDMDWLFQYYQEELEKLGGRKYREYCQSKMQLLKRRYSIGETQRTENAEFQIIGKMKKGGEMAGSTSSGDHSVAITKSGRTIEARIFKSTLDYKQVLANIEIMRNFAHASREGKLEGHTLNEILHTKDNKYLDEVIQKVRMREYKNKNKFELDKKFDVEMEIK